MSTRAKMLKQYNLHWLSPLTVYIFVQPGTMCLEPPSILSAPFGPCPVAHIFNCLLSAWNDVFGTTFNPWALRMTPGGSSGGSAAALAMGQAWLATGELAGSGGREGGVSAGQGIGQSSGGLCCCTGHGAGLASHG